MEIYYTRTASGVSSVLLAQDAKHGARFGLAQEVQRQTYSADDMEAAGGLLSLQAGTKVRQVAVVLAHGLDGTQSDFEKTRRRVVAEDTHGLPASHVISQSTIISALAVVVE